MLHALRTSVLALALRRGIATLLALCVCVAFAEPALADTCDDDAKAARSAQVEALGTDAASSFVSEAASSQPTQSPASPVHALHVCHCVHAHVAPLMKRQTLATAPFSSVFVRVIISQLLPPSVVQEPQLRPPRLLSLA